MQDVRLLWKSRRQGTSIIPAPMNYHVRKDRKQYRKLPCSGRSVCRVGGGGGGGGGNPEPTGLIFREYRKGPDGEWILFQGLLQEKILSESLLWLEAMRGQPRSYSHEIKEDINEYRIEAGWLHFQRNL